MAYTILNNDGTVLLRLADGTVNSTQTSITFVGRDVPGYGQYHNQNLAILLTNSANPNYKPPSNPIKGQLWYDSSYSKLRIFDGVKFITAGGATLSGQPPAGMTAGDFWYDTTNQELNYFTGYQYNTVFSYPVGETSGWYIPQLVGAGTSIVDNVFQYPQQVVLIEDFNVVVGAISNSTFTATGQDSTNPLRFYQANQTNTIIRQGLNIFGNIAATATIYSSGLIVSGPVALGSLVVTSNIQGQTLQIFSTSTLGPILSTGTIQTNGLMKATSMETNNILVTPGISNLQGVLAVNTTVTNLNVTTQAVITGVTNATSTNSGALQVAGGAGIGGDVWIGGDLYVDGTQTIVSKTTIQTADRVIYVSTASGPAAVTINSGLGIGPVSSPYATLFFTSDGYGNGPNAIELSGSSATTFKASTLNVTRIVSPYGSGANITIKPDGLGDVVLPANAELILQSVAPAGSGSGSIQASGGGYFAGGLYVGGVITGTTVTATTVNAVSLNVGGNASVLGSTQITGNLKTSSVTATNGVYVSGSFGGAYTDGVVVDYVTGNGRIYVGPDDSLTIYSNPNTPATMITVTTQTVTLPNNAIISKSLVVTANIQGAIFTATSANITGNTTVGGVLTVANTITSTAGSGNNIVIDPDGNGDVIFPVNTEIFVQSTAGTNGSGSGALVVTGGVGVAGGIFVSGTVTATTFVGAFSGGVTGASSQVQTVAQPASGTYYPTFVNANNASATGMNVYTTSSLSVNPATGLVTIGNASVTGALTVTSMSALNGGATVSVITATTLNVTGTPTFTSQAAFNGGLTVTSITATTSNITGNKTVGGSSVITGNLTATIITATSLTILGNATFTGNILPTTGTSTISSYSLGSPTQQWKSLYVSSATIYIGNTSISSSGTNLQVGGATVVTTSTIATYASLGPQGTTGAQGVTGTQGTTGAGTQGTTGAGTQGTAGTTFTGGTVAGITTFTNTVIHTPTTNSVSTTTGALQVAGGVGIGGYLVANQMMVTNSYSPNFFTIYGSQVATPGGTNFVLQGGGASGTGQTYLNSPSQVNLDIGGSDIVQITGSLVKVTISTVATSTTTGALAVTGGVGIGGALFVGNTATIISSVNASSTTTGALIVSGGVGIGGDSYVGGSSVITGNLTVSTQLTVNGPVNALGKIYGLTISFPSQASGVATGGGLGLLQPTTSTQAVTIHQVTASTPNGAFVTAIVSIKYGAGSANTGTITTIASSNMSLGWYAATANTISATQTTGVASTVTMSSMQFN